MSLSPVFIAFEGIDGCGKSTQADALARHLGALLTREPGATALGTQLRSLLLHSSDPIAPRAEALLMVADRAQHVADVVRPALAIGRSVVTDRFSLSTLAYQGYGRGMDLGTLRDLTTFATKGLRPDLTFVLDVPLEVASARRQGTGKDRIEAAGAEFFQRVRRGFLELAATEPGCVVLDGTRAAEELTADILRHVREFSTEERAAVRPPVIPCTSRRGRR